MAIEFLLIFMIARYLRTSLNTKEQSPEWDEKLRLAIPVSMSLFVLSVFLNDYKSVTAFIALAAMIGVVYLLYTVPFFKPARSVMVSIVPYVVIASFVSLVKIITPGFYQDWNNLMNNLRDFSILWAFGAWFVTNRQRKELDKTKKKVAEEAENNKIITAMKAELEVQVAERTAELTRQKEELEQTVEELKSTQKQLIQSEKMASLGELTAGIAHEIQNPLNFVNNFSEVNKEMIAEMKEEMDKGNYEDAKQIADDISSNEEKIVFHGKRADAIVKGMLQHSRSSSGVKEPTDINALADEYFRLAYHGLRAKDKSFNATMKSDFDETIGKVNVLPQDLGRVILNLITNAFYTVAEKKRAMQNQSAVYEPTVTVSTKKLAGHIEIKVSDNGNGIPDAVKDKIFQPFFTTKPTGQGTGLGLSMSFEIITKGHNGEIKVATEQGKGSTFIITIPA